MTLGYSGSVEMPTTSLLLLQALDNFSHEPPLLEPGHKNRGATQV